MEKEDLLEMGKSIVLPYKLSLGRGSNVICYKSVHHPFPTRGNREHPGKFQNESESSPSVDCPGILSSCPNSRGEEGLF